MLHRDDLRMTSYERQIATMRREGEYETSPDPERLVLCALGMVEEASEALEASVIETEMVKRAEEIGDAIWYAATAAHDFNATIADALAVGDASVLRSPLHEALRRAALYAGLVKKHTFYEQELSRPRALRAIGSVLRSLHRAAAQDGGLEWVESCHVDKLKRRFPSGRFTIEEARARIDEKGST